MSDNVDEFLAHYGVPGMKWGKRKNPDSYQAKADKRVGDSQQKFNNLKSTQGRGSSQTKAAGKELKIAKLQARAAPSKAGAVLLGTVGRKERYTSPEALQKRSQAIKLGVAASLTSLGSMAANQLQTSNNPRVRVGASMANLLMGSATTGLSIAALTKGYGAAKTEQEARRNA